MLRGGGADEVPPCPTLLLRPTDRRAQVLRAVDAGVRRVCSGQAQHLLYGELPFSSARALDLSTMAKLALNPAHPERVCWGCDQYCRADDLACGNGTVRTQHPVELFGPDWLEWAREQGAYGDFDPSAAGSGSDCSVQNASSCVAASEGTSLVAGRQDELKARAVEALRQVLDPELGVSIVDLGLVYRIDVAGDGHLEVDLTMTSPACPLGAHIVSEAGDRLRALSGVRRAEVTLVWDPPWDPARMSAHARALLGWAS